MLTCWHDIHNQTVFDPPCCWHDCWPAHRCGWHVLPDWGLTSWPLSSGWLQTVCSPARPSASMQLSEQSKAWPGVLLERQLVVFCPSIGILSMAVLATIPLLRPFAWQSLMLPILPDNESMLHLLDAPVPFVIGIQVRCQSCAVPGLLSALRHASCALHLYTFRLLSCGSGVLLDGTEPSTHPHCQSSA